MTEGYSHVPDEEERFRLAKERFDLAKQAFNPDFSQQKEARRKYIARRQAIENHFRGLPLNKEVIAGEGGAKTLVLTDVFQIPEHLRIRQDANAPIRVSIYSPGIWEFEDPNTGNRSEAPLLHHTLVGKSDVIVLARGEGLNREAYCDIDSFGRKSGVGQVKVAKAVAEVLEKRLNALYPPTNDDKPRFTFALTGYSEGATLAVNLGLELQERFGKLGNAENLTAVKSLTAIVPAGLTGPESQEDVRFLDPVKLFKRSYFKKHIDVPTFPQGRKYAEYRDNTLYVDSRMIASKSERYPVFDDKGMPVTNYIEGFKTARLKQGYEAALGDSPKISLIDDAKNVLKFPLELALTQFLRVLRSQAGGVPWERVRAVLTRNPDYRTLVQSGVDLNVITSTSVNFFPFDELRDEVNTLREQHPKKSVRLIAFVGGTFADPHNNPNGAAFLAALAEQNLNIYGG